MFHIKLMIKKGGSTFRNCLRHSTISQSRVIFSLKAKIRHFGAVETEGSSGIFELIADFFSETSINFIPFRTTLALNYTDEWRISSERSAGKSR